MEKMLDMHYFNSFNYSFSVTGSIVFEEIKV